MSHSRRGLRRRIVDVDEERALPVPVLVVLVEQRDARALAPVEAAEALLGARELGGAPVNGAVCIITLSRAGTFTFQSPPSSASAQTSVAGSVGRHSKSRGPVGTPAIGTRSASGSFASVCDRAAAAVPDLDVVREALDTS